MSPWDCINYVNALQHWSLMNHLLPTLQRVAKRARHLLILTAMTHITDTAMPRMRTAHQALRTQTSTSSSASRYRHRHRLRVAMQETSHTTHLDICGGSMAVAGIPSTS